MMQFIYEIIIELLNPLLIQREVEWSNRVFVCFWDSMEVPDTFLAWNFRSLSQDEAGKLEFWHSMQRILTF